MVIIDSDIFIGALRGNAVAEKYIFQYKHNAIVSIFTKLELFAGARTALQKKEAEDILVHFNKIKINNEICLKARRLLKEYNNSRRALYMPDALIAATALHTNSSLLTFNHKDFSFIKNLKLK